MTTPPHTRRVSVPLGLIYKTVQYRFRSYHRTATPRFRYMTAPPNSRHSTDTLCCRYISAPLNYRHIDPLDLDMIPSPSYILLTHFILAIYLPHSVTDIIDPLCFRYMIVPPNYRQY